MITTERLLLRRWRDEDRDPFAALNADPVVMEHMQGLTPRDRSAREALRYGFEEVGLDEVVSFTVPQNERSWRVMERIGLRRDPSGDFDHPRVDPIAYPDLVGHVFYRLARTEWLAGQGARVSRP